MIKKIVSLFLAAVIVCSNISVFASDNYEGEEPQYTYEENFNDFDPSNSMYPKNFSALGGGDKVGIDNSKMYQISASAGASGDLNDKAFKITALQDNTSDVVDAIKYGGSDKSQTIQYKIKYSANSTRDTAKSLFNDWAQTVKMYFYDMTEKKNILIDSDYGLITKPDATISATNFIGGRKDIAKVDVTNPKWYTYTFNFLKNDNNTYTISLYVNGEKTGSSTTVAGYPNGLYLNWKYFNKGTEYSLDDLRIYNNRTPVVTETGSSAATDSAYVSYQITAPVDIESFSDAVFTKKGGGTVGVDVTVTNDEMTEFTVAPEEQLEYGAEYTLTLNGAKDLMGGEIPSTVTKTFVAGDVPFDPNQQYLYEENFNNFDPSKSLYPRDFSSLGGGDKVGADSSEMYQVSSTSGAGGDSGDKAFMITANQDNPTNAVDARRMVKADQSQTIQYKIKYSANSERDVSKSLFNDWAQTVKVYFHKTSIKNDTLISTDYAKKSKPDGTISASDFNEGSVDIEKLDVSAPKWYTYTFNLLKENDGTYTTSLYVNGKKIASSKTEEGYPNGLYLNWKYFNKGTQYSLDDLRIYNNRAPVVTELESTNGTDDASVSYKITAPIDAESFENARFMKKGGGEIAVNVTVDNDEMTEFTVTPAEFLEDGCEYTLILTGAKDLMGGEISPTVTKTFVARKTNRHVRRDALNSHINNMLLYNRNVENSTYPNLFAMGLNSATKEPIVWKMNKKDYIPSNFFGQQNFYRTLVGLSEVTGDDSYKNLAQEQVKYWFDNFTDNNGLFYTGAHTFVDIKSGDIYKEVHELKGSFPYVDLMFDVDSQKAQKYIEAVWNSHILDWNNLAMDRHGRFNVSMGNLWDNSYTDTSVNFTNESDAVKDACAFLSTAIDLIEMAFKLSDETGDSRPVIWAKNLIQKYMDLRNDETGLSGTIYGEHTGGDRDHLQFGGDPALVDIAYERNYINTDGVRVLLGEFSSVLLKYLENHPDDPDYHKILDYVVGNFKSFNTHAYDENGILKLPMFSDGTSLKGYTIQVSGYRGNKGSVISGQGEYVHPSVLRSAVLTYKVSGDREIWEIARKLANNSIGELGTKPGENVLLKNDITLNTPYIFTLLDLYDMTGNVQYLKGAEALGDKIAKGRYSNGVLVSSDRANVNIDTEFALALVNIEAAIMGKYNNGTISNIYGTTPLDLIYDGYSRVQDISSAVFGKPTQKATAVNIPDAIAESPKKYDVIPGDGTPETENVRKIQSLGHFSGKTANSGVTSEEFYSCLADLVGMSAADFKKGITDKANDPKYTAFVNGTGGLTLENAAAISAGAVMLKGNHEIEAPVTYMLDRFSDEADINQSIYDYVNIAASHYIVGSRGEEILNPTKLITVSEAAEIILKTVSFCDNELVNINASLENDVTDTRITYSSSNENAIIVDENGNIFPVGEGSSVITAKSGSGTAERVAEVRTVDDDDLRDIWINGRRAEDFSPFKYKYTYKSDKNENTVVTARTYSGEYISSAVKSLPYMFDLSVRENSQSYKVAINLASENFKVSDGFEKYELNTSLSTGLVKDGITWRTTYGNEPVVAVDPLNSSNQVLKINYRNALDEVFARFNPIPVGAKAEDDKKIILEYNLLTVENMPAGKQFETALGDIEVSWGPRMIYKTEANNTAFKLWTYNGGSEKVISEITNNVWHCVKIIMDKHTLNYDVYYDGLLVYENAKPWYALDRITQISTFSLVLQKELGFEGFLYIDDIKVYETENPGYVPPSGISMINLEGDSIVSMKRGESVTANILLPDSVQKNNIMISVIAYDEEGNLKNIPAIVYPSLSDNNEINLEVSESCFGDEVNVGDNISVYAWDKNLVPILMSAKVHVME